MNDGRTRIDPENRYPSEGLLRVERHALGVLAHLPHAQVTRTRDAIEIAAGQERGLVVLVSPEAIEFRLPTVEWTMGAYGPAPSSRLWKRVRAEKVSDQGLGTLIQEASEARRLEFRDCKYCGTSFPPERRHGDVCHACAERHEGIVH